MPETEPQLTETQLAEIEARAHAASEGPWRWRRDYEMPDGDKHWELSNPEGDRHGKTIDASLVLLLDRDEWLHRPAETQANWEFIAHARTDIPALIRDLRALRAANETLGEVGLRNAELIDRIHAWSKCEDGYPLDEHINNIATQNAALRDQLQEEQIRNQTQAESIMELEADVTSLRTQLEQAKKQIALWFGPNTCSVCGGAPLASGRSCVCGGKGTMQAEFEGLRQELFDMESWLAQAKEALTVIGGKKYAPLFEAKLLGFGEGDRVTLCEPCLRQAIANDLVVFSSVLPAHALPAASPVPTPSTSEVIRAAATKAAEAIEREVCNHGGFGRNQIIAILHREMINAAVTPVTPSPKVEEDRPRKVFDAGFAATPVTPPSDVARKVAEEIHAWIFSSPTSWPITGEATIAQLTAIIERHLAVPVEQEFGDSFVAAVNAIKGISKDRRPAALAMLNSYFSAAVPVVEGDEEAVDYRKPHVFDPIGSDSDECECGLTRDADIHPG